MGTEKQGPLKTCAAQKREFHFKLRMGHCRICDSNTTAEVAAVSFPIGFFASEIENWSPGRLKLLYGEIRTCFLCAIPSRGVARKSSESRVGVGWISHGATPFFIFSQIFGLQPWGSLALFSNEAASCLIPLNADANFVLKSDNKAPFQKSRRPKKSFELLERFSHPI